MDDCWVPFENFDAPDDVRAGRQWAERPFWSWIHASAWAAAQDVELAMTLAAYDSAMDRRALVNDPDAHHGAQMLIISSRIGMQIFNRGERALLDALARDKVRGYLPNASREPRLVGPVEWVAYRQRLFAGHGLDRHSVGQSLVTGALIAGQELLASWPLPPSVLTEEPILSRRPKTPTVKQNLLLKFLKWADGEGRLSSNLRQAHADYTIYCRNHKWPTPLKRTAFELWVGRFRKREYNDHGWLN